MHRMGEFLYIAILLVNVYQSVFTADVTDSFLFRNDAETVQQQAEGEKQFLQIKSNANLPQYGNCWTEAIRQIDTTCSHLTDKTQASLALQFTKCFMAMSSEHNAEIDACEISDFECIGRLPERDFQAYTHFYTHTQNICFYLMHQIWHADTEQTINLLRTHSQSVSKQLEIAGRLQINLLQQQREGLKLQRQLVEHGVNLSEVLNESQGSLSKLTEQFKNSTIEQGRQLGDLFKRLAQLHNWFVGEYTFIEQILYYSIVLVAIMIFTTAKRTENCRFSLFLMAAVNLTLESIVQRYFGADYFVEDLQVVLYERLWLIRKAFIASMITTYITITLKYVDSQRLTINLLKSIHDQNIEMLQLLQNMNSTTRTTENGYLIADKQSELRQSVDRIEKSNETISKSWGNIHRNVRRMAAEKIDLIRETSIERIRNEDISISSRLRPRRMTPNC